MLRWQAMTTGTCATSTFLKLKAAFFEYWERKMVKRANEDPRSAGTSNRCKVE